MSDCTDAMKQRGMDQEAANAWCAAVSQQQSKDGRPHQQPLEQSDHPPQGEEHVYMDESQALDLLRSARRNIPSGTDIEQTPDHKDLPTQPGERKQEAVPPLHLQERGLGYDQEQNKLKLHLSEIQSHQGKTDVRSPESTLQTKVNELDQAVQQGNLDREEAGRILHQLNRLFDKKDWDEPGMKFKSIPLASAAINAVLHTSETNQGMHNTCNVTTVRENMLMREPSEAVRLTVDAFTSPVVDDPATGKKALQYNTDDGHSVFIPMAGVQEDGESAFNSFFPSAARNMDVRDYFGQVLDQTMINAHWQKKQTDARYSQEWTEQGSQETLTVHGETAHTPELTTADIEQIMRRFAGRQGAVLSNSQVDDSKLPIHFSSPREFSQLLDSKDEAGELPVILLVNPARMNVPVQGNSWHVVSLVSSRDGQGGNKEYLLSNQWGNASDRWLSSDQIYSLTK